MKRLLILKIAFISMIAFTIAGGYFWYLYFNEKEEKMVKDNVRLQLLNNGPITYINAIPNDDNDNIPVYYFRVKNNFSMDAKYTLIFNEIDPSTVGDGCSMQNYLKKDELMYVLTLDNKVIKKGKLSELNNNILDNNTISGNTSYDYSLKVYIEDNALETLKKHYHYSVTLKAHDEENS